MSVTPEQIASSTEGIQAQLANEKIVDWDQVNQAQQSLGKAFQAQMESIMQLRDNLQRNYLTTLKELKGLDPADLLKQISEKKQENTVLKHLVDYAVVDGEKVTLDVPTLKSDVAEKQKKFIDLTKGVTDKLFETSQWIQSFLTNSLQGIESSSSSSTKQVSETTGAKEESKEGDVDKNYKFYFDEDKLTQICSKITVQRIPNTDGLISIKTYSEIVEHSVELAEKEFVRLTFDNRKERRDKVKEPKEYLELMMNHLNEVENMLMKSQEDICSKLGISQKKLEQSEVCLMERGLGQQLFMIQAQVRNKIKEKLPKNKSATPAITKEIIEYQVKLLKEKQDSFIPVLKNLPQTYEVQQIIPVILNLILSDLVYEEYSLEEEDYIGNLIDQKSFKEQEVMELFMKIEQGFVNLLQSSGLVPKEAMQGPGGMPGMPPAGGMPGMPPAGGMPGMPGLK